MIIDGNWLDISTIAVAALAVIPRPIRRRIAKSQRETIRTEVVGDVLNGATLVPFGVLIASVFSTDVLRFALESDKVFVAIGGMIGICHALAEIGKP